MTQVDPTTPPAPASTGVDTVAQRMPGAARPDLPASLQFRRLLEALPTATGAHAGDASENVGRDVLARLALRAQGQHQPDARLPSMPQRNSTPADSASGDGAAGHADKAGNKHAAANDEPVRDSLPVSSSAGQLPGVVAVSPLPAQAASGTTATGNATTPTSMGELAQLLSAHCQGVYVGVGAAGDAAGRVMLRLGGAMAGVSAEIINIAAGLCVRLHVADHDKRIELAAHTDELERLLSASGQFPVRVESVLAGGRS
ncbi:MAG TPA: hypothetical protein VLC92_06490 [Rhodocyclaceae bacterium]|nr:hypothetical protein [Rhodocyclaceae bacterium]